MLKINDIVEIPSLNRFAKLINNEITHAPNFVCPTFKAGWDFRMVRSLGTTGRILEIIPFYENMSGHYYRIVDMTGSTWNWDAWIFEPKYEIKLRKKTLTTTK